MTDLKKVPPGMITPDLDFSDGELADMGAEVVPSKTAAGGKSRRRRSKKSDSQPLATEPSRPIVLSPDPGLTDPLVEEAFGSSFAIDSVFALPEEVVGVGEWIVDEDGEIENDLLMEPAGKEDGATTRGPGPMAALAKAISSEPDFSAIQVTSEPADEVDGVVTEAQPTRFQALATAVGAVIAPTGESAGAAAVEVEEDDDAVVDEAEELDEVELQAEEIAAADEEADGISAPRGSPAFELALRARKKKRVKQWFEEVFDESFLRTVPAVAEGAVRADVNFIEQSFGLEPTARLLDIACGTGSHAMEFASRGYRMTGIDLSLPLLIQATDRARQIGQEINFVHGDMREMNFPGEFDGAYLMNSSFGYFDDETNRRVVGELATVLKPGGRLMIDVVNRDYLCRTLPTRVWWKGQGCLVLEEVDFNYFSSRLKVQRSIIFEEGKQVEQEISIRAYALHEIGKVLHHAGFRVIEVSGGLSLRGNFFGAYSRQLLVLAEKQAK